MDAPFCKPCNKRHYGPCNVFMANSMANESDPVLDDPVFIAKVNKRYDELAAAGKVSPEDLKKTYKYRDVEKRKTYQRDLMRKRRAECSPKS